MAPNPGQPVRLVPSGTKIDNLQGAMSIDCIDYSRKNLTDTIASTVTYDPYIGLIRHTVLVSNSTQDTGNEMYTLLSLELAPMLGM